MNLQKFVLLAVILLLSNAGIQCASNKPLEHEQGAETSSLFDEHLDVGDASHHPETASKEQDNMTEKNEILSIPCEELASRWKEVKNQHSSCKVKSDCFLVGDYGPFLGEPGNCSCRKAINPGTNEAVSHSARPQWKLFMERFRSCFQHSKCFADIPDPIEADCGNGVCIVVYSKGRCF